LGPALEGRALAAATEPRPRDALLGLADNKRPLGPGVPAALTDPMGGRLTETNEGRLGAGVFALSSADLVDGCGGKGDTETEDVSEASPGSTDGPGVGRGAPVI
jgi:hypothetical protein